MCVYMCVCERDSVCIYICVCVCVYYVYVCDATMGVELHTRCVMY